MSVVVEADCSQWCVTGKFVECDVVNSRRAAGYNMASYSYLVCPLIRSCTSQMSDQSTTEWILAALNNQQFTVLRPSRGGFQSDVYLVKAGDKRAVVKDFSRRPWVSRVLVCRMLIKREMAILERFADSGFVPGLLGRVTPDVLAMEFLRDAVHPSADTRGKFPDAYSRVAQHLAEFHDAGYAHNDFRRNNVMMLSDGTPYLIDFASATRKPQRLQWLLFPWVWLIEFMQRADRASLLKMRRDFTGEKLTSEELKSIRKPKLLRIAQKVWSKGINEPILRRFK